ncbi:MAG TPA: hypothetical protein VLG44_08825 [Chlamydiales bacterium]|nr:hypothetical protein [Chlamydiales bacterium]
MSALAIKNSNRGLVSNNPTVFQKCKNLLHRYTIEVVLARPKTCNYVSGLTSVGSLWKALENCKALCWYTGDYAIIGGMSTVAKVGAYVALSSALSLGLFYLQSRIISAKDQNRVSLPSFKKEAICSLLGIVSTMYGAHTGYGEVTYLGFLLNLGAQISAFVKAKKFINTVPNTRQGIINGPANTVRPKIGIPAPNTQKPKTETAKILSFTVKPENFKSYVTQFETKVKQRRKDLPIAAIWETLKVGYSKFLPKEKIALKAEYEKGERLFKAYQASVGAAFVSAAKTKPANVSRTPNVPIKR